ncbi:MAG: hypothetical protein HC796_05640 [Synechococcaceae cyanobacterium RL_1_2]|nr:hypothetical protein [Synechococcaceae cyanobacterium RL_1_2]
MQNNSRIPSYTLTGDSFNVSNLSSIAIAIIATYGKPDNKPDNKNFI